MDVLDSLDLTLRALNTRIPEVDAPRCLATRYQSSSCRRCVQVCPAGAITPTPILEVDPQECLGCGACAVVCPTGALDFAQPRDALRAGLQAAARAGSHAAGHDATSPVTIACIRGHLSAGEGAGIRVECLGSVAAGDLLFAHAAGVDAIYLVDGGCGDCPLKPATTELAEAISAVACVVPVSVTRLTAPGRSETTRGRVAARSTGPILSRRQFLLFFGLRSAKVVETSLKKPDGSIKALHAQKETPLAHRLLRESLRTLAPSCGDEAVGDRDADGTLLTRQLHLARVVVGSACDGCGLCVRYCPHGALKDFEGRVVADSGLCTACGLCVEVCPADAVSLETPL
jgi:ferredoxin